MVNILEVDIRPEVILDVDIHLSLCVAIDIHGFLILIETMLGGKLDTNFDVFRFNTKRSQISSLCNLYLFLDECQYLNLNSIFDIKYYLFSTKCYLFTQQRIIQINKIEINYINFT